MTAFILVHGAGCTPAALRDFASHFDSAASSAVLVPALPGRLGDARAIDSVVGFADALAPVVSAAAGEHGGVVLVGNSLGGAVAMELALASGAHAGVRGVVLLGSGSRLRVAPSIFEELESDFPAAALRLAGFFFASPSASASRIEAAVADMMAVGQSQTIRDFRACDGFDAGSRLHELAVPLLAITGERDVMTPPKYALTLVDRVPSGAARIIPDAGHFAMVERPDDVAGAVVAFAAALDAQG